MFMFILTARATNADSPARRNDTRDLIPWIVSEAIDHLEKYGLQVMHPIPVRSERNSIFFFTDKYRPPHLLFPI
jgi:hypothetical protein